ncbi:hypothetical protein M153_23473000584, partial [Pseudoloma neurophilia]
GKYEKWIFDFVKKLLDEKYQQENDIEENDQQENDQQEKYQENEQEKYQETDQETEKSFHMEHSSEKDEIKVENDYDRSFENKSDQTLIKSEESKKYLIATPIDKYVHIYEHLPSFPPSHTFRRTITKESVDYSCEKLKKRIEESLRAENNLFKMMRGRNFINFLYQNDDGFN